MARSPSPPRVSASSSNDAPRPRQRPRSRSRSRSRSPYRPSKPRANDRGLRWKDKSRHDDHTDSGSTRDRGLARGYRDDAAPRRDQDRRSARPDERKADDAARPRRRSRSRERGTPADAASVASKFGGSVGGGTSGGGNSSSDARSSGAGKSAMAPPPRPPPAQSTGPQEPMIVVNVNDRLGTKAAIPCLASDPVRLFKAQVAARIGRQPHEIMLKRQGERPFKDMLTLEDYGVSDGVQLDLELDTGD